MDSKFIMILLMSALVGAGVLVGFGKVPVEVFATVLGGILGVVMHGGLSGSQAVQTPVLAPPSPASEPVVTPVVPVVPVAPTDAPKS